jgi:GNAT superfamily N-acetyltransferase
MTTRRRGTRRTLEELRDNAAPPFCKLRWVTFTTRQATVADVDQLLLDVQLGFDSYVAFAPLGWEPPDMFAGRERTAELVEDSASWVLLALEGGVCAGHVGFFPARERAADGVDGHFSERAVIPGLAHLWQLFVRPPWWGKGVAPRLHEAAVTEMRARGFERARLLTPSLHARARRFYQRRGWSPTGEEWSEDLALMLTEYGLSLTQPTAL